MAPTAGDVEQSGKALSERLSSPGAREEEDTSRCD